MTSYSICLGDFYFLKICLHLHDFNLGPQIGLISILSGSAKVNTLLIPLTIDSEYLRKHYNNKAVPYADYIVKVNTYIDQSAVFLCHIWADSDIDSNCTTNGYKSFHNQLGDMLYLYFTLRENFSQSESSCNMNGC